MKVVVLGASHPQLHSEQPRLSDATTQSRRPLQFPAPASQPDRADANAV